MPYTPEEYPEYYTGYNDARRRKEPTCTHPQYQLGYKHGKEDLELEEWRRDRMLGE